MKQLIGVLLIVGALWGLWALREFYVDTKKANSEAYANGTLGEQEAAAQELNPQSLKGMHYSLESKLSAAEKGGAEGLKRFLNLYRPSIHDPRLAWIQLEYVVLVANKDPAEARAVFAEVKARTPTNSPVYPRIQKLSKVYD